jgi:PAS domain S-box-containing protein
MDLRLIHQNRPQIKMIIWSSLIAIFVFVNLLNTPDILANRATLNVLVFGAALFTYVYYQFIAKKYTQEWLVFTTTVLYALITTLIVHYSGFLNSILFPIVFIPILISALVIGANALFAVVTVDIFWLLIEFYFLDLPAQNYETALIPLWEKLIAITIIATVAYYHSRSLFKTHQIYFNHRKKLARMNRIIRLKDSIFNSVQEMMIALDRSGRIIACNQSFINFTKLTRDKILKLNYREILNVYELDYKGHLSAEKDLLLTGHFDLYYEESNSSASHPELQLILKGSRKEIFVNLSVSPLSINDTQEAVGSIVIIQDISEKIQEKRMQLDFVSIAAHELRTPITSIRGYLSALKEEAWNLLNDDQKRFLQRADISTLQLANLMENILAVSKIERGSYTLEIREVDWIQLVDHRIEEFNPRVAERDLRLIWNKPTKPFPNVLADPLRIIEVVNNLISNAINYTQHGEIEVRVELDEKEEYITTSVRDTGPGIPKENQEHIFEKFFRVSGILEQGSKGTGLGLYISKNIVELHHGKIWVQTEVDKGSTFSFTLPSVKTQQIIQQTKWTKN